MASRLLARRQQKKKATTIVSKQTLEQAVQEAQALVEQLINSNAQDSRLDQLQEVISFLESVLKKSSLEMQQEGASTLDDYLDDAIMPEMAQKIKQEVDMIANMKNAKSDPIAAPVATIASGSDNWVNDREEDGKPKTPEVVEVPRMAGNKKAAPAPVAPAAPAPAPVKKPNADITQLSSDTLAKMQKALAGSEDLMNDKAAQAFIAAIAEELMNRPVETEAPEVPAPAAAVAPAPVVAALGGLYLAAAEDEDEESKTAATPPGISEELMHKLKSEYPGDKEKAYATAWTIHNDKSAALKVLNAAAKAASGQGGSWFVQNDETFTLVEDGGRTPEIAGAHGEQDDKTGIKRPATELPSKFAVEMTTNKAVKMVERLGDQLKALYLEAKPVTQVLDSRPVREAVESVYRAYDMMGEAAKVLNKLNMQEESEAAALEVKDKNKKGSLLDSLILAGEE